MANKINLPEETLMRLGFKTLDLMYGKLTIKNGIGWDEVFVNKNGVGVLAYSKPDLKRSYLCYLYKDRDFFLSIIPVDAVDYQRIVKAWMFERYKRWASAAIGSLSQEI